MTNYFGFIDETGVLVNDPNQRYFGIGLIKTEDTVKLYKGLASLKANVTSSLPQLRKPFEFKFKDINKTTYKFYYRLIDFYFSLKDVNFCCLVFDKLTPQFNVSKYFPSIWEAYIAYSKLLIKNNISSEDLICILADYIDKPRGSQLSYETEVKKIIKDGSNVVYNACLLESHASLYIQMVDVLAGSVVYDFKCSNKTFKTNTYKKNISDFVKKKLRVNSLAKNLTVPHPNYFSVWQFRP